MFSTTLVNASRVRSFHISRNAASGWEIQEREDERVLWRQCYDDWHRLERAQSRMNALIEALERDGWQVCPQPAAAAEAASS